MGLFCVIVFIIFVVLLATMIYNQESFALLWSIAITLLLGVLVGAILSLISAVTCESAVNTHEKETIKSENLILLLEPTDTTNSNFASIEEAYNTCYIRVYKEGSTINYKYCVYDELTGPATRTLDSTNTNIVIIGEDEMPRVEREKIVFSNFEKFFLFTFEAPYTYTLYVPEGTVLNDVY